MIRLLNLSNKFWYGFCIVYGEEIVLLKHKVMKKLMFISILALLLAGGSAMRAQSMPDEYLGLPGDNLNLYAVMKLFQESETLEGFERNLNDENSRINNLDLNRDNMVDYITVSDYVDGNVHTIVLRTALSRNESQDVAVFIVEKLKNGEVRIQLIGDEALYGRNYIIEPNYAETANPGYLGTRYYGSVVTTSYYDIAAWPMMQFIFHPAYVFWHSAWYWGHYPYYWNPWHPYYWHYYYGYHSNWYPHYYQHYHHGHDHYYAHYHDHYYNHVRAHSQAVTAGIQEGRYRSTYSRPEQRKEGEALYARTNPARNTRTLASTSTGNGERRTSVQPAQGTRTLANGRSTTTERSTTARPGGQNATTQRSTSASGNRTAVSPSATPRTTTTQRSTSSSGNRTAVSPSATPRTTTTQRSTSPSGNRAAVSHSSTQRTTTANSSSSSISQRTSSRPSTSVQRSAPVKSSGSISSRTASHNSRSSSQMSRSTPSNHSGSSAHGTVSQSSRSSSQASRASSSSSRSSSSKVSGTSNTHRR